MDYKRVVIIGAHPDDWEFGCGAFAIHLANSGARSIALAVMTGGEQGGDEEDRRIEQKNSENLLRNLSYSRGTHGDCEIVGYHLPYPDTELTAGRALIQDLEKLVAGRDLVLCQWPFDTHQDHRALGAAIQSACRFHPNVLFYQSYSSLDFNPKVFFPFDPKVRFEEKWALMECHLSQVRRYRDTKFDMKEAAITAGRANAMLANLPGYAEGFVPHRMVLA